MMSDQIGGVETDVRKERWWWERPVVLKEADGVRPDRWCSG